MIEFVLSSSSAEHSVKNIIIKYLKLTQKFNFSITLSFDRKTSPCFSCSIVQKMKSLLSSDMTVILIHCFFFSFFFCFSSHFSHQISGTNGDKFNFGTSYIMTHTCTLHDQLFYLLCEFIKRIIVYDSLSITCSIQFD